MTAAERPAATLALEGEEPADHELYEEYVRGFDEIPVLSDAVRIPPQRATSPSFVHGERRSLRKQERPDGYLLREQNLSEMEALYGEYLTPKSVQRKRKTSRAKKKDSVGKRRRKSSAAA